MKPTSIAAFFLMLGMQNVFAAEEPFKARTWERIEIEGAQCGDGSPYAIFLSSGDPTQVVASFMGGGACWDFATCYGPKSKTHLHGPVPPAEMLGGIFSRSPHRTLTAEMTHVYFPYCTGDVHLGRHTAQYDGFTVHHEGAGNIEKALAQLLVQKKIQPEIVKELVLYGFSAGAIGILYHIVEFDRVFAHATKKTLIPDSPGLHFGNTFWQKFSPTLRADYQRALEAVGYPFDPDSGLVVGVVRGLCQHFKNWRVSVLQSSHDVVMSKVFGDISATEHARRVFGKGGLWQLTRAPNDNCTAWIPANPLHTFLISDVTAFADARGTTAFKFLDDQLTRRSDRSHRD